MHDWKCKTIRSSTIAKKRMPSMMCPVCNVELRLAERQGIEIDYCPKCRGIWLDRGELDKIIDKSQSVPYQDQSAPYQAPRGEYREERVHHDPPPVHYDNRHNHHGGRRHKKKSFLEEIFDFD
jgi:Zn-finger nucleic acid-binding protein